MTSWEHIRSVCISARERLGQRRNGEDLEVSRASRKRKEEEEEEEGEEGDYDCPICQDVLAKPVRTKHCRHVFCGDCFHLAVQAQGPHCPMCRGPVSENEKRAADIQRKMRARRRRCRACGTMMFLSKMRLHYKRCRKYLEEYGSPDGTLHPVPPTPQTHSPPTMPQTSSAPPTPLTNLTPPTQQYYPAPPTPQTSSAPPTPLTNLTPPTQQYYPAPPTPQTSSAPPLPLTHLTPPTQQYYPAPPTPQTYSAPPLPLTRPAPPTPLTYPTPPTPRVNAAIHMDYLHMMGILPGLPSQFPIANEWPVMFPLVQEAAYSCPYCSLQGLTDMTLVHHCLSTHRGESAPKVCPICARTAWGDPIYSSRNLIGHLARRHRFCYDTYMNVQVDEDNHLYQAIQESMLESRGVTIRP